MTDIDAPSRYAEPAADQSGRGGNVALVVALALGLAVAAVGLAMISREMAEPFVLAILGGLAVVGVFCLFAGAVSTTLSLRSRPRSRLVPLRPVSTKVLNAQAMSAISANANRKAATPRMMLSVSVIEGISVS